MKLEKSPVRSRESAGGFNARQVASIVLIAISIACSTSKSASPSAQVTGTPTVAPTAISSPPSSTQGSTPCTLGLGEAPLVNRIKLSMTAEEVLNVFPGSKEDTEVKTSVAKRGQFGNSTFAITPSKYANAADFKEVSRVSLSLLDGKVSGYTVTYNGPEWPHIDKFVEKFVQNKTLPGIDQWEPYEGMDNQMKTLTCTGFSIRLFSGGEGGNQNYALVEDLEAKKQLKERRKKAQEQASPTPAP